MADEDPGAARAVVDSLVHGLAVLERHPRVGRPAEEGMRELVISHGRSGYVALYDYLEPIDTVVVLAVRHQREAGYD